MGSAIDIARYFLWLAAGEPEPELVTHMRLQKLLYYAQGWSLATRNRPMFDSVIEAWTHGPVVRDVYPSFADYAGNPIALHEGRDGSVLSPDDRDFVQSIWENYRKHSAIELRRMTHTEPPWVEARRGLTSDERGTRPLSVEIMSKHFRDEYSKIAPTGLGLADVERMTAAFVAGRGTPLREVRGRVNRALRSPSGT